MVSGTTEITKNPIGVKIAKNTSILLNELGLIKEGFSFQSGAGGVSLRVTKDVKDIMIMKNIKASFFSGGITKYHVEMLEMGLVEKLYDVQCFDLEAIESLNRNEMHLPISASRYANPANKDQVIKDLDIVILGATEIDLNFNVNVTTDSHQKLIGGSGGHSDTATESKVCVIVSPLIKGRIPVIKERVTTITTLGKNIDCFVTERGIAINPKRTDLLEKLKDSKLKIYSIEELADIAYKYTKVPKSIIKRDKIIGEVEDRT
ncbi:MAG: citrate lyase subunit alpha, partial [Candidatus Izimaplasma sp.]|nr:citrate lyase subunit alpha [Candidatus Izimaplasma bacterium]